MEAKKRTRTRLAPRTPAAGLQLIAFLAGFKGFSVYSSLACMSQTDSDTGSQPSESRSSTGMFPRTRWTMVLDAQADGEEALANLCKDYWKPLYFFALRLRATPSEAEDLTQGFFEKLLSREILNQAQQNRGKLRSFLLTALKNYAADEYKTATREKRGGKVVHIDIDSAAGELALPASAPDASPEIEFDRAWARQLLSQVFDKLKDAYESAGKGDLFEGLKEQLVPGGNQRPYAEIARELGITEPSYRFAAFKIRSRYRDLLRELIAETVSTEEEIDEELAHIKGVFGS